MKTRWAIRVLGGALALSSSCAASDDQGDTRRQALAFATEDIACERATDCCAVLDGCMAQLLVVAATDLARVEDLLASAAQDACLRCIAPPVQVDCVEHVCVAAELVPITSGSEDTFPSTFARTHCGKLSPPSGWVESTTPRSSPATTPPLQVRTVIGCE